MLRIPCPLTEQTWPGAHSYAFDEPCKGSANTASLLHLGMLGIALFVRNIVKRDPQGITIQSSFLLCKSLNQCSSVGHDIWIRFAAPLAVVTASPHGKHTVVARSARDWHSHHL